MDEEELPEDIQMYLNLAFEEQMTNEDIQDTIEEFKIMMDRARTAKSTRINIRILTCNKSKYE